MTRYFLLSLVFALISTITFAQTSLSGKVTDSDTGEELIAANVTFFKGGVLITGVATDFEGNYSLTLDPGTYDVETSYVGYQTGRTEGVIVKAGQANKLDIKLGTGGAGIDLDVIVVTDYKVPLVEQDNTTQGGTLTSEDIRKFASKNIASVAAATAGMSQVDEGDAITVRGSRSNATDIYVDGIRVSASQVQEADVEQLQIITGGIPAFYGDVTGGVISITTKGPSSKFTGGAEVETSQYLDNFGYNQLRANISGPILKKKGTNESILGFRFSGAYTARLDDDPPAIDVFVASDAKKEELKANPVIGGNQPAAAYLTEADVERRNYRPDEESQNLNFTAKLDARLTKNIDVSLTGTYEDNKNKFTPGTRSNWRLLNSEFNPTDYTTRYRGNFRFRHKLGGGNTVAASDEAGAQKSSLIQNAEYTLQFGYEKGIGKTYDPRHEDRFFDYGHYGSYKVTDGGPVFDNNGLPRLEFDTLTQQFSVFYDHVDYGSEFDGYDPTGARNPILANYNNGFVLDLNSRGFPPITNNGIMNDVLSTTWSGLHTNIGQVYNRYHKDETDLYTANATVSFDILPGGSEEGRHSIQLGMLFEQRFVRDYTINPERLWEIGQQSANSHILGLDTVDILRYDTIYTYLPFLSPDTFVTYAPIYNTLLSTPDGARFYREVRSRTNIQSINADLDGLHGYVNINSLNPDELTLDMFAPRELSDSPNTIGYYGYDYLGNRLSNDVTFEDFFTSKDPDGARSFLVPANQPNYLAFFVQDKFQFKDIIFRVGVRVDRYDANTKVLKDPYSLYDINTVGDLGLTVPDNIGSDFKVYRESATSNTVRAFRDGDQWYLANGTAVNDGALIFGANGAVFPSLKDPESNIKEDNYNVNNSFEDYKPQINVMPRLAFSFPISDAANFFAHYDILVQRPPSNAYVSPLSYYYFYDRTPENNANLKPERTIDYEVGFQQKLSNSSAIKIAAYYKEMRDMIQLRNFTQVHTITEYLAYDNQDFGTVKGFTFQYDLRRTGNVSANVNYTLQFADGTGSDPESARALANRGRIRNLYPLNFDERHRIVTSVDYRYDSGKRYNGPRWFGKDVFASAGVNLQAIAVSGRPYTATQIPNNFGGAGTVGSINGARKPWTFTLNMRVDKNFNLTKPGAKRPLGLNVYFRVQNLLDARNIVNVYSASGSPTDDGFLASDRGQANLNSRTEEEAAYYVQSYSWALQNPNNFSQPRRMYLGAIFDF